MKEIKNVVVSEKKVELFYLSQKNFNNNQLGTVFVYWIQTLFKPRFGSNIQIWYQ